MLKASEFSRWVSIPCCWIEGERNTIQIQTKEDLRREVGMDEDVIGNPLDVPTVGARPSLRERAKRGPVEQKPN
jgi:hypothetical protein